MTASARTVPLAQGARIGALSPQFQMHDLPRTSRAHAEAALEAARAADLTRVRLGTRHFLGMDY